MDVFTQVFRMLGNEAIIILAILVGATLIYYAAKVWKGDASLMLILGAGLLAVTLLLYFSHINLSLGISSRAALFMLLYAWCVLGMLFFAGRGTHYIKLLIALASQAGILYALFRLI